MLSSYGLMTYTHCRCIYLDYNATTPLAAEVAAAMRPYLEEAYGNPSSLHWAGRPAREAVDAARSQVAALLGCDTNEVAFTSGGTEANNQALKGVYFARHRRGLRTHIITSQIEHPAVLQPCRFLESLGAEVTRLRVDRQGLVDPDDVRRAIRPETGLVSIMHANNEVGTIQPIADIAALARRHGIHCHTDAAQTAGKLSVDVAALGVDLLTIAGHKLYGPKGVGVLFVRRGVEIEPLLHGAGHEAGRRASTESVLQIVGLGAACELARRALRPPSVLGEHLRRGGESSASPRHVGLTPRRSPESDIERLRDHFWLQLQATWGDRVVLNGHVQRRLPNTLSVGFLGCSGHELLARLPQVAASTGSACHAGSTHLSPVLEAMGVSPDVGLGTIRFSLGRSTTAEEIDEVVEALAALRPPD